MENNYTERIPEISLAETFGNSHEQKKMEVSLQAMWWVLLWSPVTCSVEYSSSLCH